MVSCKEHTGPCLNVAPASLCVAWASLNSSLMPPKITQVPWRPLPPAMRQLAWPTLQPCSSWLAVLLPEFHVVSHLHAFDCFPSACTPCPASSLGSMILVQLKSLKDSAWASPELGSLFFCSLVPFSLSFPLSLSDMAATTCV